VFVSFAATSASAEVRLTNYASPFETSIDHSLALGLAFASYAGTAAVGNTSGGYLNLAVFLAQSYTRKCSFQYQMQYFYSYAAAGAVAATLIILRVWFINAVRFSNENEEVVLKGSVIAQDDDEEEQVDHLPPPPLYGSQFTAARSRRTKLVIP
jgi:hypothetical protein